MLSQCVEPEILALALSPCDLFLDVVEHRDDVAETIVDINVTVGDGQEQHL